ncbi:Protein phosphatase 1 regulatory subunit 12C [Larimichthys crocea]|uniref:Uncharacterized protein n=1 Tax=Larimichthys crocea TaxID=215358 RepID=A0ACD3RVR7_LARCR|nr:Protein phosphatase 1 regulatory subunit 12C [Larimichthys crocea]
MEGLLVNSSCSVMVKQNKTRTHCNLLCKQIVMFNCCSQEKLALQRKAVELEDELKVLGDLRADNQRLKDENAALIRVISKLSR